MRVLEPPWRCGHRVQVLKKYGPFSTDLLALLDFKQFLFNQMTSLARLAPQKSGNLELVLFDRPGLIGAAAVRVHHRMRSSLRGRRMLGTFAVLGMNRTWLLLRGDRRLRRLPRGRLLLAQGGPRSRFFLAADAKRGKPFEERTALGFGMRLRPTFASTRANLVLRREWQIVDLRHPLWPHIWRIGWPWNERTGVVMLAWPHALLGLFGIMTRLRFDFLDADSLLSASTERRWSLQYSIFIPRRVLRRRVGLRLGARITRLARVNRSRRPRRGQSRRGLDRRSRQG
jgi:hypothetical protein